MATQKIRQRLNSMSLFPGDFRQKRAIILKTICVICTIIGDFRQKNGRFLSIFTKNGDFLENQWHVCMITIFGHFQQFSPKNGGFS
jgi:hypothetical protein